MVEDSMEGKRTLIFRRAVGKSNPTPTVNFALPNHMRLNTQLLHASQRPRTRKEKKGRDKHTTITILAITINRHHHRHLPQQHRPLTSAVSLLALSLPPAYLSSSIRVFLEDDQQHGVTAADAVGSCVVQVTEPRGSLWLLRLYAR
jgi:hypothetical protein